MSYIDGRSNHPLYNVWRHMIQRCTNEQCDSWNYYGARGIGVCLEWQREFWQFVEDVGPRPGPEFSLDRIDNDGHYEPGNVRWATWAQQNSNKRGANGKGRRALRTHCRRGHAFDKSTVRLYRGVRVCRICTAIRSREAFARVRVDERTHCVNGHALEGDNLYVYPSNGKRLCKTCRRANDQRAKERHTTAVR